MSGKRKSKFSSKKEARRRSRETIGPVPGTRVIPDKRRKPVKHKKGQDFHNEK